MSRASIITPTPGAFRDALVPTFALAAAIAMALFAIVFPGSALAAEPQWPGQHIYRLPPIVAADNASSDTTGPAAGINDDAPADAEDDGAATPDEELATPPPSGPPTDIVIEELWPLESVVYPGGFTNWSLWHGSVELGLSGTSGNSETFNVRLGAKAKRDTPRAVHTYELTYLDKSADSRQTAHSALIDGRSEWPFPDTPWSFFIHGLGEYDEFKAFDFRASGDTGLGYQFIKNDVSDLKGRFGGSASHEFGGPDDDVVPELVFGAEWKHCFSPRQNVSVQVDYFPNVTAFTDFRMNGRASWEVVVAPEWGLSLKTSVIDRYDSTPGDAKSNDLDYSLLLLWSF
jgi:putative salt-induced outer membrane protein YdiY